MVRCKYLKYKHFSSNRCLTRARPEATFLQRAGELAGMARDQPAKGLGAGVPSKTGPLLQPSGPKPAAAGSAREDASPVITARDKTQSRKEGFRASMSKGAQIAIGASLIVALLGWFAWTNLQEGLAFQYYKNLDEFMAESESLEGRPLRVHGYVASESIYRNLDDKNVRFSVQNDPPHAGLAPGQTLDVLFLGLETPDMFKDGAEVVIEGRLRDEGTETLFLADNLMAKCPSKFEAQGQAMGSGPDNEVNL